jgi:alkylation response protein AidB-like acyl-CoA dehydrogenase
VSSAEVASDQSGFTQYFVSGAMGLDVHGFAAKDTPAGAAAREQIRAFIVSGVAGAPKITVPAACMGGRCSF